MAIQEHNSSDILFPLTTQVYFPIQIFFIQIWQKLLYHTKYTLCFLNYCNIEQFLQFPHPFSETLKIYFKFKLNHRETLFMLFSLTLT